MTEVALIPDVHVDGDYFCFFSLVRGHVEKFAVCTDVKRNGWRCWDGKMDSV